MSNGLRNDGLRFMIAGSVNTVLTSGIYLLLVLITLPEIAYAVSWIAGLIFVVLVYPDRVFVGGRKLWSDRLILGSTTIGVFVLGLFLLRSFNAWGINPQISFFITLFCTTVTNFILGRFLLRRPGNANLSATSALSD